MGIDDGNGGEGHTCERAKSISPVQSICQAFIFDLAGTIETHRVEVAGEHGETQTDELAVLERATDVSSVRSPPEHLGQGVTKQMRWSKVVETIPRHDVLVAVEDLGAEEAKG